MQWIKKSYFVNGLIEILVFCWFTTCLVFFFHIAKLTQEQSFCLPGVVAGTCSTKTFFRKNHLKHLCRFLLLIKLQLKVFSFIKNTLRHWHSPANILKFFRRDFSWKLWKNVYRILRNIYHRACCENSYRVLAVNYLCKKCHHRCF